VCRYKALAAKHGYIDIQKNYMATGICSNDYPVLRTHYANLKKVYPETSDALNIKGDEIVRQGPDLFTHNLQFRRRKKIEPYIKRIQGNYFQKRYKMTQSSFCSIHKC